MAFKELRHTDIQYTYMIKTNKSDTGVNVKVAPYRARLKSITVSFGSSTSHHAAKRRPEGGQCLLFSDSGGQLVPGGSRAVPEPPLSG